jgi:hypothetical protein
LKPSIFEGSIRVERSEFRGTDLTLPVAIPPLFLEIVRFYCPSPVGRMILHYTMFNNPGRFLDEIHANVTGDFPTQRRVIAARTGLNETGIT